MRCWKKEMVTDTYGDYGQLKEKERLTDGLKSHHT